MEYYIYDCPLFVFKEPRSDQVNLSEFAEELEKIIPAPLIENIDVVYIGDFPNLKGKNAAYDDGAIFISYKEPTNADMIEDVVHEIAHSLEPKYGMFIYEQDLQKEFRGKRERLRVLLNQKGHKIPKKFYNHIEYNKAFDEFLSDTVGYPLLLNLTMGLFASPYGATSLQEYYANGFEKYLLGQSELVKKVSPVLYTKIDEMVKDATR